MLWPTEGLYKKMVFKKMAYSTVGLYKKNVLKPSPEILDNALVEQLHRSDMCWPESASPVVARVEFLLAEI